MKYINTVLLVIILIFLWWTHFGDSIYSVYRSQQLDKRNIENGWITEFTGLGECDVAYSKRFNWLYLNFYSVEEPIKSTCKPVDK